MRLLPAALALARALAASPLWAAERLVVAGGDLTEIAFALGEGERVVGVDSTSTHPPEALALPQMGCLRRLSPEGVLALAPDRLIAAPDAGPPSALEVLEAAGLDILMAPEGDRFSDVPAKMRFMGEALDRAAEAEALAARFEAELAEVLAKTARLPDRPRASCSSSPSPAAPPQPPAPAPAPRRSSRPPGEPSPRRSSRAGSPSPPRPSSPPPRRRAAGDAPQPAGRARPRRRHRRRLARGRRRHRPGRRRRGGLPPALRQFLLPAAAFLGAGAAMAFVFAVARRAGETSVATLILAGVAVTAITFAGTGALIYISDDSRLRELTFWTMGGLGGAGWTLVLPALVLVGATIPVFALHARALDLFQLGERAAFHAGLDVERAKLRLGIAAALAVGGVTAAGPVSFIGLVAPHLARLTLGPSHRHVLPGAAAFGIALTLAADLCVRLVAPRRSRPIGLATSLIGGPFFLWLLLRDLRGPRHA